MAGRNFEIGRSDTSNPKLQNLKSDPRPAVGFARKAVLPKLRSSAFAQHVMATGFLALPAAFRSSPIGLPAATAGSGMQLATAPAWRLIEKKDSSCTND